MNSQKKIVEELLALTDIEVNGSRPWDIRVLNNNFYSRILKDPSMQMGETYMDGWWGIRPVGRIDQQVAASQAGIQVTQEQENGLAHNDG